MRQDGSWFVISASATGSAHTKVDMPCQDSFRFSASVRDGVLVAAVADGAGSAKYSRVGSEAVAREALRTASRLVRLHALPMYEGVLREVLAETVHAARRHLEQDVRGSGIDIREYATTLIVAICTSEMTGTAQIGDGAVVTSGALSDSNKEDPYLLFSPPQRGEYVNETNFITSKDWRSCLDIRVRRVNTSRLLMFTDGIQSLALDPANDFRPHSPFFTPLLRWAENQRDTTTASNGLKSFLSSPRVTDRTDDDLTLLVAMLS